jgi:hypothetical protein
MNIQTVAQNLRNTISGKEKYLDRLSNPHDPYDEFKTEGGVMARRATIDFLKINIDELKRILADIEKCVAKDVEQSWINNPDRSGGQYTEEEINRGSAW